MKVGKVAGVMAMMLVCIPGGVSAAHGQSAVQAATKPSAGVASGSTARARVAAKQGTIAPLDVNSATAEQLKTLPGISASYSQKIITARPYARKTDLVSRRILPESIYSGIADQLVAREWKE